ncbi:MAG: SDR family oxidoreductase [Propionibacteriales bacterium]|nr:SDR family oxidoreductase [Propionibacteriales bacterium]
MPAPSLVDRVAVVSGSSRGIGRACALALALAGASVTALVRSTGPTCTNLENELTRVSPGSRVLACDVTDPSSVVAAAEDIARTFGRVDVLVNNAGIVSSADLVSLTLAEWHRVMDTNITGTFLLTQALLPLLGVGASVVNIGSGVAAVGMPARAHYTASKAATVGFTRSLCKELGPIGVRANVVTPGIIDTDQVSSLAPEQRRRYESLAALGRLGTPEDVADVVVFLAGDQSRFISGATIPVDGGI